MSRQRYRVEGWRRLDCVSFRPLTQHRAIEREANHLVVDEGCDRVIVWA